MSQSTRTSLALSFSQTYYVIILQFIASLIVARLLAPEELGVFAVSAVLIGIAHTVRDFGVAEYIVQESNLTEVRIRSALMSAFLTGWGAAIIILLASDTLAQFYRDPGVGEILKILSINFFLIPFSTVTTAVLRRRLEMRKIAIIRITSATTQFITLITLALLGFSYLSMALAGVASAITNIILLYYYRPNDLPFIPGVVELRRVFSFGSYSSVNSIFIELNKGAPELLLGYLKDMESVAFFSRATGAIELFNRLITQSISYVALPHFSNKVRTNGNAINDYIKAISYIIILAWPFFIFLGLSSESVITVLYGEQWTRSVSLVTLLCVGELLAAPFYLQSDLFISHGMVRAAMLVNLVFTILKAGIFILTAHGELETVAISYSGIYALYFALCIAINRTMLHVPIKRFAETISQALPTSLTTLAVMYSMNNILPSDFLPTITGLFVLSSLFIVTWIASVLFFKHPISYEINNIRHAIRLRRHH